MNEERLQKKENGLAGGKRTATRNKKLKKTGAFEKISCAVTRVSGSTGAFIIALSAIIIWIISGPVFDFSDTWQLVINTGTTIITFLMVFLIQRTQNKDSIALHLKLNELIIAHDFANNRLVSVEEISEEELQVLKNFYRHMAELTHDELTLEESHSLNRARHHHQRKSSHKAETRA